MNKTLLLVFSSAGAMLFLAGLNISSAWVMPDGWEACDPIIEPNHIATITATGESTIPQNMFDIDSSTRWSDDTPVSVLTINLDSPKTLCSTDIAFYRGDERVNLFTVDLSSDGQNWVNAFSGQSSGTTEDLQHFIFNDKYLGMQDMRYTFAPAVYHNGTATDWTSITELMIDRPNPDYYSTDPDGTGGSIVVSHAVDKDKFGIAEIYPTKNGKEWYVDMDNPTSDPRFANWKNANLKQMPDGSWQVSSSQIRLEAYSPANDKWLNTETTMYAKMTASTNPLLQIYGRGGHHTSSDPCLGSAYKARLYGDGRAAWVKELTHPAYAGNRGTVYSVLDSSLMNKWIGFKAVIYNKIDSSGNTYVRLENYVDNDVTDSKGNLVIRNNWQLASVYEDHGGWSTSDADFTPNCPVLNVDDHTHDYRQRGEILSSSGNVGKESNLVAWRTDDSTWQFQDLTVREILSPQNK